MKTPKNNFYLLFFLAFGICITNKTIQAQDLEIVNVRVGQGDATIIQGPVKENVQRINILVDAGDSSGRDGGYILRTVLNKKGLNEIREIQAIYQNDVVITSDGDKFTISTSRVFDTDENPREY